MKLVMFPFRVVGGTVVVAMLSHVMEDLLNDYIYMQRAQDRCSVVSILQRERA
jgi:hypothetical protein